MVKEKLIGYIERKDSVLRQIGECNNYIATHCYYCKNCWQCRVTTKFNKEIIAKGIKTFNADKKWWSIDWSEEKNGEIYQY